MHSTPVFYMSSSTTVQFDNAKRRKVRKDERSLICVDRRVFTVGEWAALTDAIYLYATYSGLLSDHECRVPTHTTENNTSINFRSTIKLLPIDSLRLAHRISIDCPERKC